MLLRARPTCLLAVILLTTFTGTLRAQKLANSEASYQKLRDLLPGDDVLAVNNLVLHRDAATFTFTSGSFVFYGEVNGKVTGAVFTGEGHFHLAPPSVQERHNLEILVKSEEFNESFDKAVLRFTDDTAAELRKAASAGALSKTSTGKSEVSSATASEARDLRNLMRTKLKDNLDLRLLEDVLSPAPGGLFLASMHGKANGHLIFRLDPHGAPEVEPEEVVLLNWNDWGENIISAFHAATDAARGGGKGNERNSNYRIDNENLDVTIEKDGFLGALATVHVVAEQDGVAVVPLDLYAKLRVSRVESEKGDPLDYVQEKKDEDSDFGVVLAKPLKKGETATLKIAYGGKEVVFDEGGFNYYPVARENWYPNAASGIGDYASYQMLFHVPKGIELIATGTKVSEKTDGKLTTTEWKTDVPLAMVGFNLGKFKMSEAKLQDKQGNNLTVDAYANTSPPNALTKLDHATIIGEFDAGASAPIGNIDTTSMLPKELSEAQAAAQIYNAYFGQIPFTKVAVTQQAACNYGQSWPMLVYLPICGFMDTTQQHFLGLSPEDMYWKTVTSHEVAHQWWGQTVGFRSYRDQWMSEGFADESASIFLQLTRPKPDDFLEFWKEQRKLITEKNQYGFRPIDVGPVTMGFRLSSQKAGWSVYQSLVYPKGAYILHMIRQMMWSPKDNDQRFMDTMHDLLASYRLQAATTEDFKAVVEKHMSPSMDLEGNHKMDWFFNQYVYGTDLPEYHFESQATPSGDGTSLHVKLTQSGVSPNFRMLVPIYLELTDGRFIRLGSFTIIGPKTIDQTLQLPKMPAPVKRAVINHNYDVLSIEN